MIELEPTSAKLPPPPPADQRPKMRPPPPVRLIAVEDVRLEAMAGQEAALDAFYVDLLRFERQMKQERPAYDAANFRIEFDWYETPIQRDDFRMLGIEIPSLGALEAQLIERKIEYVHQRGLLAGREALGVQDPAGNWLELVEYRRVMA
jgi:hypothetical protein